MGVAHQDIDIARQAAVDVQFDTAAARFAYGDGEARIVDVAGEDIVLLELIDGERARQRAVQQRQLGARLDRLADFGVEYPPRHIGADIGAEALAIGGIERDRIGDLVDHAELRADPIVLALAVDAGEVVFGPQAEIIVTRADADLQAIG